MLYKYILFININPLFLSHSSRIILGPIINNLKHFRWSKKLFNNKKYNIKKNCTINICIREIEIEIEKKTNATFL